MSSDRLQQAAAAYRSGRIEDAEALALAVCRDEPGNEQAVLMCSGLMLHRQANADAESLLRTALENGLESGPAKANLALCCSRLERHAEAEALAAEVTADHPELISAWNARAAALLAMGQAQQAEQVLERALEVHPDQPALTLLLGHARKAQDRSDEAEDSYRRFDRQGRRLVEQAEALTLSGRLTEAEHQYRQLVATQPGNAAAHSGLGRLMLRMGRTEEAVRCLQQALKLQPDDPTSRHFLSVASGEPAARAHPDYVRALFDDYAENFDTDLTQTLGYRIPEELASRLEDVGADLRRVLDLGCGTGLMAEALCDRLGTIDGVDLSPKMLAQARQRERYRELAQADILTYLDRTEGQWTTVLAADVLVYVGELDELARQLARRLEPGGWFAFSIELSDAESGRLDPHSGRFQHHPDGVDRVLQAHGFLSPRWTLTSIRQEFGKRIPGAIGLAQRQAG
ncbi:hypothetical protein AY599_23740 [Leptolyngbya valderiana BDU 20041]|nr:hypothetical protein AY599_23740 [Leptolyngbya valderiana BDU 20041]